MTSTPYLYCGVPRDSETLSISHLPDDYDQMALFTSDDIYQVNLQSGAIDTVFNDQSQNFDVSDVNFSIIRCSSSTVTTRNCTGSSSNIRGSDCYFLPLLGVLANRLDDDIALLSFSDAFGRHVRMDGEFNVHDAAFIRVHRGQ